MAKPSTLKNLILTLVVITCLSAAGLGGMSILTQEPIAKSKSEKVLAALKEVLPDFDNDPATEKFVQEVIRKIDNKMDTCRLIMYPAKKAGQMVGTAVESFSPKGFGGKISIMVGFDKEGKISGYSVLEHAETPGLGDRMVSWFKPPVAPVKSLLERIFGFEIKAPEKNSNVYGICPGEQGLSVSKSGGTIDAITAATISSRAFLDAVNLAYAGFRGAIDYTGATPSNDNKVQEEVSNE